MYADVVGAPCTWGLGLGRADPGKYCGTKTNVVALWVKNLQLQIMMEICSTALFRANGIGH